jgi:hypothetical protein
MPSHDALALDRDAAGPLVVGSPIERGEVDLEHEDRIEIYRIATIGELAAAGPGWNADEPREVPRARMSWSRRPQQTFPLGSVNHAARERI